MVGFHSNKSDKDIANEVLLLKLNARIRQEAAEKLHLQYEQFAEFRNAHVAEIAAKAQNVNPAEIHVPLEQILKERGVEVENAIDFIGGYGKHTKWMCDQGYNVVFTDVMGLTEILPQTFDSLNANKELDGSIILFDKEDPKHWIYGLNTLPNEANKAQSALFRMKQTGRSDSNRAQLFLGNDMLNFVPQQDQANFAKYIDEITSPGAIIDLSGRSKIKYEHSPKIESPHDITKLFSSSRFNVLYENAEEPVSTKDSANGKKHIRVILEKLAA